MQVQPQQQQMQAGDAALAGLDTNNWWARYRRRERPPPAAAPAANGSNGAAAAASHGQVQQGNGVAVAPAASDPADDAEDDDELERVLIDAATGRLLSQAQIDALVARHIKTVDDLLCVNAHRWPDTSAFPRALLEALQQRVLSDVWQGSKSLTALELFDTAPQPIDTQNPKLNQLLGGGLFPGEVLELVGASGKGKTQLCLHVAFHVASRGEDVFVLDTCSSFDVQRGHALMSKPTDAPGEMKLARQEAMSHVHVQPVFDVFDLLAKLELVRQRCAGSVGPHPRLLIIDALGSVMSPIMRNGRGFALIAETERAVKSIAADFNVAVVTTNSMAATGDGSASTDKLVPALGERWCVMADARVQLGADTAPPPGGERVKLTLTKSTRKPVGEFTFCSIGPNGIL